MDPYTQQNRSFDTDLLILRSLFAIDQTTNLPISTNYVLTTDGVGGLNWQNPILFGGISEPNLLSTVGGLGSINYVSTTFLTTALTSTTKGLGLLGYVSTSYLTNALDISLTSTTQGLGLLGYVSTQTLDTALINTTKGLGSFNYVSTASLVSTTVYLLDPVRYVSTGALVSTTYGILTNTAFGATVGNLLSTTQGLVDNLGTLGQYVSTSAFRSSLTSTTAGLGTLGYVSTSFLRTSLTSTIEGLGTFGYVSSSVFTTALTSTTEGLGLLGYVSSSFLANALGSTSRGLGTLNYVSTSYLSNYVTNAIANIGTSANFVSTPTLDSGLTSTTRGLGSLAYVSTASLVSTTEFLLDPIRYVSSGALISTTTGILATTTTGLTQLALDNAFRSTTKGLGTGTGGQGYGYISSLSLQSTTQTLMNYAASNSFITVDRAGSLTITGGNTTINNSGQIIYLSTFLHSSVTYKGTNGTMAGTVLPNPTTGTDMLFSTCIVPFDSFSSFMNANSRVYVDIFPTFAFNELNTMATRSMVTPLSTFIQYGTTMTPISQYVNTSYLVANSKTVGYSNYFQQQIKLQIPGNVIAGNWASNYTIYHHMPGALTINLDPGLKGSSITVRYSSTNSVFVTVQNLP